MQDKRLGKYDLELRSPGQEITSEGGEMFITWQPRAALRKLRTDGDMGAAPVTMMRTRPPRDSCRWGGPRSRSATHSVTCCVTMGTGVVPGLCWRWVCPIGCWSWWCPASPQHTSCPRQSSAATSWKMSGLHSGPERQDAIRRKKQEGLRWFLKQDETRENNLLCHIRGWGVVARLGKWWAAGFSCHLAAVWCRPGRILPWLRTCTSPSARNRHESSKQCLNYKDWKHAFMIRNGVSPVRLSRTCVLKAGMKCWYPRNMARLMPVWCTETPLLSGLIIDFKKTPDGYSVLP